MRAFILTGPERYVVDDVEPPIPQPGEAVIDVERVGVCGTDVEFYRGEMAYLHQGHSRYPLRLGHEWCGRVAAVGAGVDGRWIGRRVMGDTMIGDQTCRRCRRGHQHLCDHRREVGIRGGLPGALAEQLAVPAWSLHILPSSVDATLGALVEPGGNALRAAQATSAGPGDRVLVAGPGTIGTLTALFLRAAGVEVHLLGRSGSQLEFVRSLGFTDVWTETTLPDRPFDAIVDASTAPQLPALALDRVEPGGRVVYIGLAGSPSRIDIRDLVLKDVTAVGVLSASPGLPATIAAYADRSLDPRPLVAATVTLDDVGPILAGSNIPGAGPGPKYHVDPRPVATPRLAATTPTTPAQPSNQPHTDPSTHDTKGRPVNPRTFPDRVDVAIVGSGPCGAAYARILSELAPAATVAMFEVGPLLADPPGSHVKNIDGEDLRRQAQRLSEGPAAPLLDPDGAAAAGDPGRQSRPGTFLLADGYREGGEDGLPAAAMSSNVGGMGAHWTCACPRPGGSERPAFVPDLDGLLSEAERVLGVDRHALDDAPLAGLVRERLRAALDTDRAADRRVAPMPLAVTRHGDGSLTWSGSDVVFGEQTRHNENFTLYPDALVTRVLTDQNEATGVRIRDRRDGVEHDVAAQVVVVAADSLRTPQLLWASQIRPPALGRYLNDQPQTIFAVRLRDVAADASTDMAAAGITAYSGVSWVPFTDDLPFHGQVMQLDASPVPLDDADVAAPGSIVGLGWFCAKDIHSSDRVEFDPVARDPYGMPAMRIHYTLTDTDKANRRRAWTAIKEAGRALGDPLGGEPRDLPPGSSLHYQGTVRMGQVDDGASVCDPSSQVWAVQRLYVAGNGVIPTATACNPTLLSVALAVAGARHVAASLASGRAATESGAGRTRQSVTVPVGGE